MEGVAPTPARPLGLPHIAKATAIGTVIFMAALGATLFLANKTGINLSAMRHFGAATLAEGAGLMAGMAYLFSVTHTPRKPKVPDPIKRDTTATPDELTPLLGPDSQEWEVIDLQADR